MRKAKNRGRRVAKTASFLAPNGGWVKSQNIAKPDPTQPPGAEVLQNIFPTATGAQLRGGSQKVATLGDGSEPVKSFLRYKSGSDERLFGTTNAGIYDITTVADVDVSPTAVVDGLTNGAWNSVQFSTTGGIYLVAVNGEDQMRLFDGSFWFAVDDSDFYQLNYDGEVSAFTVGETITGADSGATGTIIAVQDNGINGYVVLSDVSGTFRDDEPITDSATGDASVNGAAFKVFNGLTGIDTRNLSYVWAYKNRLFFVEKNTMNAYYADLDQVGGALTKFPLAGIFPLGGSLLFGASWSLETGADGGLTAQCVFITTEGEVAVYQGTDPSSDFSLVGVYRIGKPRGPNAWHRAGGDLVIATDIGHVPLSQAINRDIAALSPASVSYPIETAWNEAVSARSFDNWNCVVWPERQMVLIALPTGDGQTPVFFVANARTGRWCEFTGWQANCLVTFQGRLLWGSSDGKVIEGYVTGTDEGAVFVGVYVPLFSYARTPTKLKTPSLARAVLRSAYPAAYKVSMQYDYNVSLPLAPNAATIGDANVWGQGEWGTAVWGGKPTPTITKEWRSVSGEGYAMAPAVQISSGAVPPLETEIIRLDVSYFFGDVLS